MKRPSRSFVVEVRRQRRPPGEPALSWTEELQKPRTKSAARSPEPPPRPAVETMTVAAPARPTGRILPSLIEAAPAAAPTKAAKPPKIVTPKPQRRRAPAPAPTPVLVVEPPPAVVAPPPAAEPTAQAVDPARTARHRRILARYVFGDALKPGERWKRRIRGDAP